MSPHALACTELPVIDLGGRAAAAGSASPVTAADGTNVEACADGNCEVAVSGPVDIPVNGHGALTMFSVVKVSDAGISFETTSKGGGTGSGELQGDCTATFYAGGSGSACSSGPQEPPRKQTGVLAVQLVGATDGRVVLRLVSGKPGPPPSSLVPEIPEIPELPEPPEPPEPPELP